MADRMCLEDGNLSHKMYVAKLVTILNLYCSCSIYLYENDSCVVGTVYLSALPRQERKSSCLCVCIYGDHFVFFFYEFAVESWRVFLFLFT